MKKIISILLMCVLILSMVGCGGSQDSSSDTEEEQIVIGLSQEGLDHPFMVTQREQIMDAASKYPNVSVIATDGQNSVVKQVAGIEDMLSQGIDLLMVQASKAEGLKQKLTEVHEQGIPFMFVGKPISGTEAVTMVSMDNLDLGHTIGEYIVEVLTDRNGAPKGNIVMLEGIPGDQTSEDRIGGAKEILADYPDIKIIAQVAGEYRRPEAFNVMQDILQANPEGTIDFVYACNGEMALGVIQALKDAGRLGEMPVVGLDGQKEELDAIKAGELMATWLYKPAGYEGFDAAMKILNGEEVEEFIIIPGQRIDAENVDVSEPAF